MMEENKELMESGTIMYLRENTAELKRYNNRAEKQDERQDKQGWWLKGLVLILAIWTLIIVWLIYHIISNNILNNIVAHCG